MRSWIGLIVCLAACAGTSGPPPKIADPELPARPRLEGPRVLVGDVRGVADAERAGTLSDAVCRAVTRWGEARGRPVACAEDLRALMAHGAALDALAGCTTEACRASRVAALDSGALVDAAVEGERLTLRWLDATSARVLAEVEVSTDDAALDEGVARVAR